MNRWVLLEHKILRSKLIDIHYDFLIEDQSDCFTWKLHKIPLPNKGVVKIVKQLCLLYTSPSPRDRRLSRMPSSA